MVELTQTRLREIVDLAEEMIGPVAPARQRPALRAYFQLFRDLTPEQFSQLGALVAQALEVIGHDKLDELRDLINNPPPVDTADDGTLLN